MAEVHEREYGVVPAAVDSRWIVASWTNREAGGGCRGLVGPRQMSSCGGQMTGVVQRSRGRAEEAESAACGWLENSSHDFMFP